MAELSTIARPYAVATYNLAKEKNDLTGWSDMLALMSAIASHEDINNLLNDPKVNDADLEKLFLDICEGKLSEEGKNLIKVLVEYGRLAVLPAISAAFDALKAKDEGVLQAEIISAFVLSDEETNVIKQNLEKKFDKKIDVSNEVDSTLLGGMKIVVGDSVIDTSVQSQLQNLAYTLSE